MTYLKKLGATISIVLISFLSLATHSGEHIAISDKNNLIIIGGESTRAIYVLDKTTYELKKRIWFDTKISSINRAGNVWFSNDESSFWVHNNGKLIQYGVSDFTQKVIFDVSDNVVISPDRTLILSLKSYKSEVKVIDSNTGELKYEYNLPSSSEDGVERVGVFDDNSEILIVHAEVKDETEEKTEEGSSFFGIEKKYEGKPDSLILRVLHKTDQKKRLFSRFKIETGELIKEQYSWYSDELNDMEVTAYNGEYYILSEKGCATVSKDFKLKLFNVNPLQGNSFHIDREKGLIVNSNYNGLQIYNLATHKTITQTFSGHSNTICSGSASDGELTFSFLTDYYMTVHKLNGTKVKIIPIF
ncbi:MAG: hypothetical protein ACI857_001142 [Arenicella sp.]|jgi:hypothetical protein